MAKTHAEPTFADEMEKLEKTVRELEGGKLDLDAALARFEEGVKLARRLRARLDEAEGRVEELLEDGSTRTLEVE
ncbi:MAG TPA: exodeoxyribonuclease VII small subunit [Candidatus Thermoplasmatota archaeon]|nr:exodeoxyribonuclease VII small subunit [Candidatus Thermoplasmatota archaeon]